VKRKGSPYEGEPLRREKQKKTKHRRSFQLWRRHTS